MGTQAVMHLSHLLRLQDSNLKSLRQSMRSDARLDIFDRNGKGDDHRPNRDTVVSEARCAGFKLVEEYDFVKPDGMDYFLVFQTKG